MTRTLPTAIVMAAVLAWSTHAGAQAVASTDDAPQQTATAPATTAVTSTPPATTATAADPAQPADQKAEKKPAAADAEIDTGSTSHTSSSSVGLSRTRAASSEPAAA